MSGSLRRGPGGLQHWAGPGSQQLPAALGPGGGVPEVAPPGHSRADLPAVAGHETRRIALRRDISGGTGTPGRGTVQIRGRSPGGGLEHWVVQP